MDVNYLCAYIFLWICVYPCWSSIKESYLPPCPFTTGPWIHCQRFEFGLDLEIAIDLLLAVVLWLAIGVILLSFCVFYVSLLHMLVGIHWWQETLIWGKHPRKECIDFRVCYVSSHYMVTFMPFYLFFLLIVQFHLTSR